MKVKFMLAGLLAGCVVTTTAVPAQTVTRTTPTPETRVGVDAGKRILLTLREAITMALENNRDLEVERINVQLNEFDLRASQGVYDPLVGTNFAYDRRNTPVASPLAAGGSSGLKTDNVISTSTYSQKTPWQGGTFQAVFDNNRATTSNIFNQLNPQFTTSFTLTWLQPLWRNRAIDQSRRQIRIAKKRLDISDSQFRQRAIDIISQVQRAYWDLVFARRDLAIKQESLSIGRTQLARNQRLVDAGTLAPADVISTRVEVERRTDEAEAAIDAVQRAENSLKALLLQPNQSEQWTALLEPVEQPEVSEGNKLPLDDALRLAMRNRPEMEQFNLREEINKADVAFFRDQTKPQIDFTGSYGAIGLAGSQRPEPPPFPLGNGGIPNMFLGSYGQSLGNLFRNEFRTWRFGLNLSLPLRNRTAQAQLGRALAEGRQIDAQKQRVVQGIEVEVRNALQAVETAVRRVAAAKNSRENAELQLQSEERKFEAGQSTNFFVLDRQNALIAARGREVRALVDYNKAVAELQRVISTTLSSNNIEVRK